MLRIDRRRALMTGLFGTGLLALRAAATGLPAWFLQNPRRARADDMTCTLNAKDKLQSLIVCASSAGDPISCNVPGTYDAQAIIHPTQDEFAATSFNLGTTPVKAAKIWSTLTPEFLARTNFLHHITGGLVHGDHPKVMRLLGKTTGAEMAPSIYAKHLWKCLGTVQAEPVALGATGALEFISFNGRSLPTVTPTQLKELLTTAKNPVARLRTLRDQSLDELNAIFKQDGTPEQKKFLDALANSQRQVRQLSESLADTLAAIQDDKVSGQALAAAALIAAKVTPVVTLHIPFGGDNHTDDGLYDEWFDHTDHGGDKRGVPGIQAVFDALSSLQLADSTTFATMNVVGRDLSGTPKVDGRGGRDHFGNHAVMMMIGKNVQPGVSGGCTAISDSVYGAADIDSTTGMAQPSGGDIPRADTHVAAAKTLGVALGIDEGALTADFLDNGHVRYVKSAIK